MKSILSYFLLTFIFSLPLNVCTGQSWKFQFSFPEKPMPEWLINSQYEIEPYLTYNNRGNIAAFLYETLGGVSGISAQTAIILSEKGEKLAEKNNLLPDEAEIRKICADSTGNFWVSVTGADKNNDIKTGYTYAAVFEFDNRLNLLQVINISGTYAPVAISFNAQNQLLMGIIPDSTVILFGNTYLSNKPEEVMIFSVDTKSKAVLTVVEAEGAGYQTNEAGFFITHSDGSFYYIQNIVILKGPDHHDVDLYYFSSPSKLGAHRHLKGQGDLTHLWVKEALSGDNNSVKIKGYSDDLVNFEKEKEFLPKAKKENIPDDINNPENNFPALQDYDFECMYDRKLKLTGISYNYKIDNYEVYTIDQEFKIPDTGIPGYEIIKDIRYRNIRGELNTSNPPVFEFFRN